MLNISDVEEKKMIVAYHMVRNKKGVGSENVWRTWCIWWKKDFTINGTPLRMYNHTLVQSKTKARDKARRGENVQNYKEYDDFLVKLCEWIQENYDNKKGRGTNAENLKANLLKYKAKCDKNIRTFLKKSGLKEKGYKLQNQTSEKHPIMLGKYLIFKRQEDGTSRCVKQGSYEQVMNYLIKENGDN